MVFSLLTLFTRFAIGTGNCADKNFLGFVPWYHYLEVSEDANHFCSVTNFNLLGANSSLLLIGLAIIDDLFRLIGILAVGFIIFAGFKYITSQGEPAETSKALSTAINALVGLGISMVAIAFVGFLGAKAGAGNGTAVGSVDVSPLPNPSGIENGTALQTVLSIVFPILGAVAFMIIVIAGMKYVLSQGDPQAVGKAKNTIIYALVGLVLAIVAQAIVFVTLKGAP